MLNPKTFGTLSSAQARIIKDADIRGLVKLFDTCHAAREAAYGVAHQPRFEDVDKRCVETLFVNHIELIRNSLMEELEQRKPKTSIELERRNECLCQRAMMCGDFTDAAKLLVDLVSNEKNLPERIE